MAGLFAKLKKQETIATKKSEVVKAKKETKKIEETKEVVAAPKTEKLAKKVTGLAYQVLLKPIVSEKATIAEARGVYAFQVANLATKSQIKEAIRNVYGVKPLKVRVMNLEGKISRHGRSVGRRSDWKKALVTLPSGQTINIHEGV